MKLYIVRLSLGCWRDEYRYFTAKAARRRKGILQKVWPKASVTLKRELV